MITNERSIAENCLNANLIETLWTTNYLNALPMTPQNYDIGALLPVMLYMARWGNRRGKGKFAATFGVSKDGKKHASPSITDVVNGLLSRKDIFFSEGFEDDIGPAVLGDLLLSWCLENKKHEEGQKEQVQRIYPTHYLASWIDLPDSVINLRGVPEMLTVILANQKMGQSIEPGINGTNFPVGVGYQENTLLRIFAKSMAIEGPDSNQASDKFIESKAQDIGIDELLVIRLAQCCRNAPDKVKDIKDKTKGSITNRHPIASLATSYLREDLEVFIDVYGELIPRQPFLQMLEAAMSLSLTNLTLSTLSVLLEWEKTGQIQPTKEQKPWPLFVDASQGQDSQLREISEVVMQETIRRYEKLPDLMMLLRVLDYRAKHDRRVSENLPVEFPDSTEFLNLLGQIYKENHPRAESILERLFEDCSGLADGLEKADLAPDIVYNLREKGNRNCALIFAEAICDLMGIQGQQQRYLSALESSMLSNQPNGLAIKRRVSRSKNQKRSNQDLRAIILNSTMLDFLVHRHLHKSDDKSQQILTLQRFLKILREKYGLYVDQEPPGQPVSQELLRSNKLYLERRLRDLGLLIGVNDAESMKRLKSRYQKGV
jgi:hypothetical protein